MAAETSFGRRSALRLASSLGVGGVLFLERGVRAVVGAGHAGETRAIEIEWLSYTDADGQELGRIRPYSMSDITNHNGVATPDGQRDLWVYLAVRNTAETDLIVPPTTIALWDERGFIVRPTDIYRDFPADRSEGIESRYSQKAGTYAITGDPIPPRGEQTGFITYRVPQEAWFRGLLFMPEPERVLVLADFRREASVIID